MVFAAPSYDHEALLDELANCCPEALVVGASSAGEFMNHQRGEGLACALGLAGDDARFGVGVARDVAGGAAEAARQITSGFTGLVDFAFPHRSALVMADALAGHADLLVDELTLATGGQYQFFGGGAGDNAAFQRTSVFLGREVLNGAAVALEMLTAKPVGIGVRHGWTPASAPFRVTEADGMRLISLNGLPAAEAFETYAATTGQSLDRAAPIPFFLHNILGVETGESHRLRVPLAVLPDGSILCAAEVPEGAVVYIMRASVASAVEAAQEATQAALAALGGLKPQAALFFDCVATRLRMGDHFSEEVASVREQLAGADLVGCNTHGQIARAEGQFEGFHNCTAVVVVVPA
ncbi:FIST signal transduction protein [Brevundimonas sp.]|uniref:FIST signal transduction protein n=1 Tax=Brevundimonas sp. TaxID=1871086 RepID=UPI002D4FC9B5|nr:FIST N-terminal domain-containing protein [Brevundimonas sp.]HYC75024.1 FIST N-terminal domain-containing protein [Brevundimonas sp.]